MLDAAVFQVFDLDKKCKALIVLAYPNFYFQTKGFELQCSLADIRGYAQVCSHFLPEPAQPVDAMHLLQQNQVFSFETGRNCPGGSNRYYSRVKVLPEPLSIS